MSVWFSLSGDLAEIDDRLDNWGRWAHERARRGRAMSAEGRYLPERLRGEEETDRRRAALPIDAIDATVVDAALAPVKGFPMRESRLLKLHYVRRLSDKNVRETLRIHVNDWPSVVRYALLMAQNRLTRAERFAKNAPSHRVHG